MPQLSKNADAKGRDAIYAALILDAIRVCGAYRPKFGQGRAAGLDLVDFQRLYGADPFYHWFGLDSTLMYAAHKAAGGMTSIYRQVGIGCQWALNRIIRDSFELSESDANWTYQIPGVEGKARRLSLDARVIASRIGNTDRKAAFADWLRGAARELDLKRGIAATLEGGVFEIRQGYKSKDAKRQNADVANAAHALAAQYLPVVTLLSNQIDEDVVQRYRRARWLVNTGSLEGTAYTSTYVFFREIVGYDLAGFFERNSTALRHEIEIVLRSLLNG